MSDSYQAPAPAPVSVALPETVWIGGHPTVADPETRGTRLRRCVLCNSRDLFNTVSCAGGMVVHLIDPEDVHAAPEAFDGNVWAEPEAMAGSRAHWADKGFRVVRKPDGPTGEDVHPRFRPCPTCNEEAMRTGRLGPVHLPRAEPDSRVRGRAVR